MATSKRSEEHTSELQSPCNLVCRLLLEKKNSIDQRTRRQRRDAHHCEDDEVVESLRLRLVPVPIGLGQEHRSSYVHEIPSDIEQPQWLARLLTPYSSEGHSARPTQPGSRRTSASFLLPTYSASAAIAS